MSRTDERKVASGRNSNDGTAARTRPLSFEEIMLRRKNKLMATDTGSVSGLKEQSKKANANVAGDHSEHNRAYEGMKHLREKERGSSMVKEKVMHKREGNHTQGKEKVKLDSEANIKVKSSHRMSSRDEDSKNERHNQYKSRDIKQHVASSIKENEKKQPKHTAVNDKLENKDKKSRGEAKRKDHDRADEKNRLEIYGSKLKRHDLGKLLNTEYAERSNRRREDSKSYYEDPKPKRRRSRSREYNRERDRSLSFSPRAHKRAYHRRDYEESSPHSFKDKPKRKYSDGDKYRTSGNGGYSSGHYRKHGSGLGGYSPRKRRSEAAVRTPSPTVHSPERKAATWDQPPPGESISGAVQVSANFQTSASKVNNTVSSVPVAPAAKTPQQPASSVEIAALLSASIDAVQLTQASRPKRRLYIENLPPSTSEKAMVDCLNDFLLSSGSNHIKGTNPCISCMINKEKGQALVEFLTPEDAAAALSFDGRSFSGSILKIRRPKDFVETATLAAPEKLKVEGRAISSVVKDSPHKIFIGGISKALSSDMLVEIVSAFGALKAYHFEFNEYLDGPCAFLEYVDHSVTLKACAGLNGMKLGGHILTAIQTFPDSQMEEENDETAPCYDIPTHAKTLLALPTKVLQLKNVFNREEFLLLSETELEETLEDIRLECGRFGTVKSLNIIKYSVSSESLTEVFKTQADEVSTKTNSKIKRPSSNCEESGDLSPQNDAKESLDASDDVKDIRSYNETTTKVTEMDSTVSSVIDVATACEEVLQLPELISDQPTELDMNIKVDVETSGAEVASIFEAPKPDKVENETEEDPMRNDISLGKAEVTRDTKDDMLENGNMKLTAADEAVSKDDGEHFSVENIDIDSEAMNESGNDGGNDDRHVCGLTDLVLFEPGCVLVEFFREEATCLAAHCLHGRAYGERIVMAGFFPHDLYLARFPR